MLRISRWASFFIIAVCAISIFVALPNVLPKEVREQIPSWLPSETVNLGLDLQGGSYLLLEVDVDYVRRERMETLVADIRTALRKAGVAYSGLGVTANGAQVTITDPAQMQTAREALDPLAGNVGLSGLLGGAQKEFDLTQGDGGSIVFSITESAQTQLRQRAVQQSIEVVRRRIDELGTREPTIQQEGTDRILVQVPGLEDPKRLKEILGKTAKMTFHLVDVTMTAEEALAGSMPPGSEVLYGDEVGPDGKPIAYLIQKRVMLTGDRLVDATQGFDPRNGEPVVNFRFDIQGARRFADITRENVGRPFAIVLDGKVVSAPRINEPITGGSGQISGNFTVESAANLAIVLRAGALPAPMKVIEERSVGAELGADSIAAGSIAGIAGIVAVVVLMVLCYGLFGLFANVALIVNTAIIFAVMSMLNQTLTLPGIAGIILNLGMAVDANVLIFERMREESALGKPVISAMDAGFSRAFATIIDSHLTNLFSIWLLFFFGTGPIKGFAVALTFGILSSLFTAISVTRLQIVYWAKWKKPKALPI